PEKKKKSKKGEEQETIEEAAAPEVIAKGPDEEKVESEIVEKEEPVTEEAPQETPVEMKKTEYEKLEGTKGIGKIDLYVIKSDRPDYSKEIKEKREQQKQKRKRKRIYSSEKPETFKIENKGVAKPAEEQRRPQRIERRRIEDQPSEISEKQIQDKIRETMA